MPLPVERALIHQNWMKRIGNVRHSRCYSLSPETLLCLLRDYITALGKNSNIVFTVSAAVTVDIARERPTQKLSNKQVC